MSGPHSDLEKISFQKTTLRPRENFISEDEKLKKKLLDNKKIFCYITHKEVITIKLDYTLTDPKDRLELVNRILAETPNPSEAYLEILGTYLSLCMEKQERRNRRLLPSNRLATITKRETSFEKLAGQLENGEDGIYDLIKNDKNIIF